MDAFNEKKWFVYFGEKHEGPFSLQEIQGKMAQGQVSQGSFVWCEGMQDWKAMTEVPAFAPLLQSTESTASPAEDVAVISPAAEAEGDTGKLDPKAAKKAAKDAEKAAKAAAKASAKSGKRGVSSWLVALIILIVLPVSLVIAYMGGMLEPLMKNPALKAAADAASDAMRPQLVALVEKFPALSPYISPIPRLEDVAADDYEELKAAARETQGQQKYAVALSNGDLLMPVFYVTTSADNAKQVRVVVTGVGDTLLNHTSFENSAVVMFEKHLGKTVPIRFPDGKPLPRGEYIVSVYEYVAAPPPPPAQPVNPSVVQPGQPGQPVQPGQPGQPPAQPPGMAAQPPGQPVQPNQPVQPSTIEPPAVPKGRLYTKKQYFLGGPKDVTYTERLKEFHERLKGKAASELAEVKQFSATLEMQLNSTIAAFAKFRGKNPKKITKAQLKGWNDLHSRWSQLDSQLSQTFTKWTPDTITKDYFYFRLYQLTQETGQAVAGLHALQNGYFTGSSNPAQFENELLQTQTLAQASLNLLKAKIEQAEKMPPSPRGLPRREGL